MQNINFLCNFQKRSNMIELHLKFRTNQIVQITRMVGYYNLPKQFRNQLDQCKREGFRLLEYLAEGVVIDEMLQQRIERFFYYSAEVIVGVKDLSPLEYCRVSDIIPLLDHQNKLIVLFLDGGLNPTQF